MTRFRLFIFMSTLLLVQQVTLHAQYKKRGRNVIHDAQGNCSVGRTKNYLREGKWHESYPDHSKKSVGRYHLGLEEGRHIAYWPNGNVSSIRDYTLGKHNGYWMEFNENGDTIEYCLFVMDQLHGDFYRYSPETKSSVHGQYNYGKKYGVWTQSDGLTMESCEYNGGQKNGKQIIRRNGKVVSEGYFIHDLQDSVWREYENGKPVHEYWYTQGVKYKTESRYFPGTETLFSELRYSNPEVIAGYTEYYPTGIAAKKEWCTTTQSEWMTITQVDSIVEYYPNGNVKCRYIYRRQGEWISYHLPYVFNYIGYDSTGRLTFTHYCSLAGEDSLHREYNQSGKVICELVYSNGSLRNQNYYYADGKPMVILVEDSILVYSQSGKLLKPRTSAYNKIFSRLDSLESAQPARTLFPPIAVTQPPIPELQETDFSQPVALAERMPEFPGGPDELRYYLSSHIYYPDIDRENGKEGTVYVQFVVEKNGVITNVKAIKEVAGSPQMTSESIRVIKAMPTWKPGSINGQNVRVLYTLPIRFSLY